MKRELLIGCGSRRNKILRVGESEQWENLTTLDYNPAHKPDVVWDLMKFPLPFEDDTFDEIHAYEVLEHTGAQGDYKFFFAQFTEFWRILKPNGILAGTTPMWNCKWAWGDPSHTRTFQKEHLIFLSQKVYAENIGQNPMSDFRFIYKADFDIAGVVEDLDKESFVFAIRAIKPSRLKE